MGAYMAEPISLLEPFPVFVDSTGRRALIARRVTQAVAVLFVLYFALLAASVLRVPGVERISLPGVGPLFPEAVDHGPPSVDAPGVTVIADGAAVIPNRRPSGASNPVSGETTPGTSATSANSPRATGQGKPASTPTPASTPSASSPPGTSVSHGQGPDGNGPPGQQNKQANSAGSSRQPSGKANGGGKRS
jgi:hypothetical protein